MALPLKSGADLYNQQLIRAAVWNYSADGLDPSEYATGLMYFNTNPSSNMYQKLRFRTGTDWKTIAFAEDLDVATNKDFKALKERVDAFLDGEVDSNGVLDNLKEIQKFLDNYSSATDLTDILDTKLDKKGGTIETNSEYYPLILATSAELGQTGIKGKIGTTDIGAFVFSEGNTYLYNYKSKIGLGIYDGIAKFGSNTLLHSGNVGDYAIKSHGTNMPSNIWNLVGYGKQETGWKKYGPAISFGIDGYYTQIQREYNNNNIYVRGFYEGNYTDWKTIAFTEFTNAQELQWQDASGNAQNVLFLDGYNDLVLGKATSIAGYRTRIQGNSVELRYGTAQSTGLILNSSGNVTIGNSDLAGTSAKLWVDGTIATTDDIIIDASKYADVTYARGFVIKELGADLANICYVNLGGRYINIAHGAYDSLLGIRIIENGNVGIGTAAPQAKLHVNGDIVSTQSNTYRTVFGSYGAFFKNDGSNFYLMATYAGDQYGSYSNLRPLWFSLAEGDVYMGHNLTTNGTITGNKDIIANGTIACKGVAAEGSAPVGTVDKWAGSIATGTKSQTYTHGLGTTDITVAIYEKNGNEWVQILTDVDIVNANTIRVTFGANTTVEHRIVVMG